MSTTAEYAEISLDLIEPHPKNVRHDAIADEELIESIRVSGIFQPLVLVPNPERPGHFHPIAGNRRRDGLIKAGRTTAPSIIRHDLVTEAQQVEAMLIENGRREDLTALEEAEGYEQLELFGYKPKDIAKATGRSLSIVKDRLRLKDLSGKARDQLHDGQITLADAAALVEFADDHEMYAEAESKMGTPDFRWKMQELRNRRQRAADNKAAIARLNAAGAEVFDEKPDFDQTDGPCPLNWFSWGQPEREEAGHDGDCIGYVAPKDDGGHLMILCCDPSRHRQTDETEPETAEEIAEREAREAEAEANFRRDQERAAALRAATTVRVEWLGEHLASILNRSTGKNADMLAGFAHAAVPAMLLDYTFQEAVQPRDFGNAVGADLPTDHTGYRAAEEFIEGHAAAIAAAPPREAIGELATWLAVAVNKLLEDNAQDATEATRLRALWDWIRVAGYELPSPDIERVELLDLVIEAETNEADA